MQTGAERAAQLPAEPRARRASTLVDLLKKFDKQSGGALGGVGTPADGNRKFDEWRVLFVAGMWFQDLCNYDFRRTEMCIIPYGTQMGEISFCAYNTGVGWRHIVEKMYQNATRRRVVTRARQASGLREPAQGGAVCRRTRFPCAEDPQGRPARGMDATPQRPSVSSFADARTWPLARARRLMTKTYDVVIAGGGLAGLTLARQLRREPPGLRVFSPRSARIPARSGIQSRRIERRDRRALLPQRLDLDRPLRDPSSKSSACATSIRRTTTAASRTGSSWADRLPPVPSFQLDRGRLENFLLDASVRAGVDILDDSASSMSSWAALHRLEISRQRTR